LVISKISQGVGMRSESAGFNEEDKRGQSESKTFVVEDNESWVLYEAPPEEESAKRLTQELFGDVLAKIDYLLNKDKKKFEKVIKEKSHGNKA
jgi:hypothetical protein